MKNTDLMGLVANLTGTGRTVVIPTAYVEWLEGDYVAAVVLNDCVWATNWKIERGQDGWFWRSEEEWRTKRFLSRKQVVRAIDSINARAGEELIERDLRKISGAPVMHFRVVLAAFTRMVGENWILPKRQNPGSFPIGQMDSAERDKSYPSENTSREYQGHPPSEGGAKAPPPLKSGPVGTAKENRDRAKDIRLQKLVKSWAEAMGYRVGEVKGARKAAALKAAAEFPARVTEGEVRALVEYLKTKPYFLENPARLTMAKALEDLLGWEKAGRPATAPLRATSGGSGAKAGVSLARQRLAEMEREEEQAG